uniref:C2H2-type domain-containing protein n=1 Tax=Trichogramma kaykai TaxID=54128 RepID=A0ABD2W1Y0_9HYME
MFQVFYFFMYCKDGTTLFICQKKNCSNAGSAEATKVCYNHKLSISYSIDSPPPIYLCIECANEIHRENANEVFHDILHPVQHGMMICENKNCRSTDKAAVSICFSTECVSYNSNRPIRYCQQCHGIRHNNRRGSDHIFHLAINHILQTDLKTQAYIKQSIMSLLQDVQSARVIMKNIAEINQIKLNSILNDINTSYTCIAAEECHQFGRFGIWLLIGLCSPVKHFPEDILNPAVVQETMKRSL